MSKQMNIEELKVLIANNIKEENLQDVLPEDAINKIKDKILFFRNRESAKENAKEIPNIVSELDVLSMPLGSGENKFPDENQALSSPENPSLTANTNNFFMSPGSQPTEQMSEPKMGYTPELPEILKKAEPAEVFVFKYTDINQTGENLTYKPFRLMDDPDVMKSMKDLWIENGKTKANIYVAKFEKIGEIDFNYTDGVSKFIEKGSEPDYIGGSEYKENPYVAQSTPQIEGDTKKELETYIKSSVDLEKVIHDIVMGIVKDSLLTNTEKAVTEDIHSPETPENNGYSIAQAVKPMEESISISMKEIVERDDYEKITLPTELNESINSGDKSLLINENEEVQIWKFDDNVYYTPKDRISKNKGYIKK